MCDRPFLFRPHCANGRGLTDWSEGQHLAAPGELAGTAECCGMQLAVRSLSVEWTEIERYNLLDWLARGQVSGTKVDRLHRRNNEVTGRSQNTRI